MTTPLPSAASALLKAICESQVTIGVQMSTDARSAQNISTTLVTLSNSWSGNTITESNGEPNGKGNSSPDPSGTSVPRQGDDTPNPNQFYTNTQIQAMVQWFASQEANATGDTLTQLQAKASTWTNLGSSMNAQSDLQKSPFNTMQQGESSQINQDQSAVSGSSSLGSGIADFDSIVSNLVPSIQ
jgi:hypothetical protein